ncbi:protein of unknown function [Burkholderia multivorans]
MLLAGDAVEPVGQCRVEEHLDQDRHREQRDDQRLLDDGFALERKQQDEGGQQRGDRPWPDPGHGRVERGLPPGQQHLAPDLCEQHRDHDVQHDGRHQRRPRHRDRGDAQQQADHRRERKHHDRVVQCDLRQREQRVAVGQPAPHEHHRGAGRGGQQNEAGHVAVELAGRQHRRKHVADEQPGQERHRERFDEPVDEQRHADAAKVLPDLMQRAEVHLHEHRDDHHPDEQADRQIDLCDFHPADRVEHARRHLAGGNAGDDAEKDPCRQVALEEAHRCAGGDLAGVFALNGHGDASQAQGFTHRRHEAGADVVANGDEAVEGLAVRVVEPDMDALYRTRKDRAGFLRVVAHADDEIDGFVHHGVDRLRVEAIGRQAGQLQRFDGAIGDLRLGNGAGRNRPNHAGQIVIENGLAHLGAAGIASAEYEDGFAHGANSELVEGESGLERAWRNLRERQPFERRDSVVRQMKGGANRMALAVCHEPSFREEVF